MRSNGIWDSDGDSEQQLWFDDTLHSEALSLIVTKT